MRVDYESHQKKKTELYVEVVEECSWVDARMIAFLSHQGRIKHGASRASKCR